MRRGLAIALGLGLAAATLVVALGGEAEEGFSPYVSADGTISLPKDFRRWPFLGSWHIAPKEGVRDMAGAAGFHNVYTQASTIDHYRKTGEFPDGAVIVKELLGTESGKMTTGQVSWAAETEGWFIVIKDTKGRFPDNPLWGDGWGWALFNADDPNNTVSTSYRTDCWGCHLPARSTDRVFVRGYPILQEDPK